MDSAGTYDKWNKLRACWEIIFLLLLTLLTRLASLWKWRRRKCKAYGRTLVGYWLERPSGRSHGFPTGAAMRKLHTALIRAVSVRAEVDELGCAGAVQEHFTLLYLLTDAESWFSTHFPSENPQIVQVWVQLSEFIGYNDGFIDEKQGKFIFSCSCYRKLSLKNWVDLPEGDCRITGDGR